jgi:hypothetical protein
MPNIDRLASQSLVFDHFLRENVQPPLWGIDLAPRATPWIWMGKKPPFADSSSGISLMEPLSCSTSRATEQLEEAWTLLTKNSVELMVVELDGAIPPWQPDTEDLDAYFPQTGPSNALGLGSASESEDMPELSNPSDAPKEAALLPWQGPLPSSFTFPEQNYAARERLLLTHAAAMATLDRNLGTILEFLAEHQTANTHIIFTSDQGVALGEKNWLGHGTAVPWLDCIHVPLMWCHPKRNACSLRHPALVSDRNLAELLSSNPNTPGGLLEGCWHQPRESGRRHIITAGLNHSAAVRTKDWGLVVEEPGKQHLYEFPIDHWEVNDLALRHPGEVQEILLRLEENLGR